MPSKCGYGKESVERISWTKKINNNNNKINNNNLTFIMHLGNAMQTQRRKSFTAHRQNASPAS